MAEQERVLVVDDDRAQRALLSRLLTGAGYRVDAAANGSEALRMADEQHYAIVVLDFEMPGLNGVELFEQLIERQPRLRGVIVTAYASLGTVYPAMCVGISRVLAKPVSAEELCQVVDRLSGESTKLI